MAGLAGAGDISHIECIGSRSALWYSFLLWSLPVLRWWSSLLVASIYSVWTSAWLWISCLQRHREHCQGMSPNLQQAHHYPPEDSPVQYHSCTSVRPNVKLVWWQRNRRILWPATEYHWLDAEERHSCCARRLECKRGQECLWKLARHLLTLLQWQ